MCIAVAIAWEARKATCDRRSGSGTTKGDGGSSQDPLHLPLPHRCLLLGSQGNHISIISIT